METSRIDNKAPHRAVHPSEIIKDELDARSMSKKDFAKRIGMQQSNLSRLLSCLLYTSDAADDSTEV